MDMRSSAVVLSAALLAGCTATVADRGQAVPEAQPISPGDCLASRAEAFIGKPGGSVAEDARTAAGARTVRLISPGQAVTMDYRADRLNLELDPSGAVARVLCG